MGTQTDTLTQTEVLRDRKRHTEKTTKRFRVKRKIRQRKEAKIRRETKKGGERWREPAETERN